MVRNENGFSVFRLRCEGTAGLHLAGDFNDWSISATPMQQVQPGTWELRTRLPVGHHRFRYVTAEGKWLTDFSAPNVVANPYGSWDSVAIVPSTPREKEMVKVEIVRTTPEPAMRQRRSGKRRSRAGALPPLTLSRA